MRSRARRGRAEGGGGRSGGAQVSLHLAKDGVIFLVRGMLTGVHPAAGLDHELLFLAAQDANPNNLRRSERDFSATFRAASDVAVVAGVSDAVGELGPQAYLTRRVELDAGLLLQHGLLSYLAFEFEHFILLLPEIRSRFNSTVESRITDQFTLSH